MARKSEAKARSVSMSMCLSSLIALMFIFCPARSQAEPSPVALFEQAKRGWAAMTYPDLVDYVVAITVTANGKSRTDRYNGSVKSPSRDFRVSKFSDYESQHPYVPHGVNLEFSASASGLGTKIGIGVIANPPPKTEIFAIPEITPLYSFGMRSCPTRKDQRTLLADGVKIIGSVSTNVDRVYRITLAGTETVDGVQAAHLSLVPVVDERQNRLRDVWIENETNRVLQARVDGNFNGKSEGSVPWLIHFVTIDGSTYIDREIAEAPFKRGKTTLDSVSISFEAVQQTSSKALDFSYSIPNDFSTLNVITEPDEMSEVKSCR